MRRALLILFLSAGAAQAASPQLVEVLPRGVQRGAEVTLTLRGPRLMAPQELLFSRTGVTVLSLTQRNPRTLQARVRVAEDCPLGEHPLRLRTSSGVSNLRTIYVGALPHRDEAEPNSVAQPQAVPLGVTMRGTLTREDIDVYSFEAAQGDRITAEVHAVRLGGPLVDPHLSIHDAQQVTLAVADDAALTGADAILSWVAPADGTYTLKLHESSYNGRGNARYLLHLGTFPRPVAALPAGGQPGEELDVLLIGDGDERTVRVRLPQAPGTFDLFSEREGAVAPSPLPLRVAPLPCFLESEPNQGKGRANPVSVPGALHGRLEKPGDVDFFAFEAKKGQTFFVSALARALGSPLDPVLTLWHADGKKRYVVANDDTRGHLDSSLRFRAPRDGLYHLRIRDFLARGGPTFTYRIEFLAVRPSLALGLQQNGRRGNQERNAVAVPAGGRFAVLVTAKRQGFRGPIVVEASDLPAGVQLSTAPMRMATGVVPLVFEAAADAPLAGALVGLTGRGTGPAAEGGYRQTVDLCVGPPNTSIYHSTVLDRLAVAVTEAAPFSIELVPPTAPLVKGGSARLEVIARRAPGFNKPIHVRLLYNPPGTGSRPVNIAAGKTKATIGINANGRAGIGRWPIVAIARAGHRGPLWVSSQLTTLSVANPYLSMELTRGAAERGARVELTARVEVDQAFDGAQAKLMRLPPGVTAPTMQLDAKTTELRFPVTVGPGAKLGRHRNIYCQVVAIVNGEPVLHNLGKTNLRVDPAKPRAKTPPEAEGPRPATRLEQLRAEFERQAAQEQQP